MRFYLLAAAAAVVVLAYFAGMRIGRQQCSLHMAKNTAATVCNIINQERIIDAKIFKSDTNHIRRILREKYTIEQ